MRVATSHPGFGLAIATSVGLSGVAFAGAGNTPGTGPTITGAQIMAGPVAISGDTSDNTDDFDIGPLTQPPTDCGASTAPDAWHDIAIGTTTGTLDIDIDLCRDANGDPLNQTQYDSKIYVLDATTTALQCNDETGCSSGAGPSAILNLVLAPGVYDLAIDGFGSASGAYGGQVRIFEPVTCSLDPPLQVIGNWGPCPVAAGS